MERPDWDSYLMALCFVIAQRSIDPDTKHGTVIIAPDHTILSVGFNGPPRNCSDSSIPLTRPQKYAWIVHSEEAAIANAAKHGIPLDGSIAYITGWPCSRCMASLIGAGITKIVYGPRTSVCVDAEAMAIVTAMANGHKPIIEMKQYVGDAAMKTLEYSMEALKHATEKSS